MALENHRLIGDTSLNGISIFLHCGYRGWKSSLRSTIRERSQGQFVCRMLFSFSHQCEQSMCTLDVGSTEKSLTTCYFSMIDAPPQVVIWFQYVSMALQKFGRYHWTVECSDSKKQKTKSIPVGCVGILQLDSLCTGQHAISQTIL